MELFIKTSTALLLLAITLGYGNDIWNTISRHNIMEATRYKPLKTKPKNIIMIVGENLKFSLFNTARRYKRMCLHDECYDDGGNYEIVTTRFKEKAILTVECLDTFDADVACATTALVTGVKCNRGAIAQLPSSNTRTHDKRYHLASLASILGVAQANHKRTGIVTDGFLTAPGVAPLYGNTPEDYNGKEYDLAAQLIDGGVGKRINVLLGGGRKQFRPSYRNASGGERQDKLDLIKQWKMDKTAKDSSGRMYIETKEELNQINPNEVDYVMGLFNWEHLDQKNAAPTLQEMTEFAIRALDKSEDGYFLFVRASDHGYVNVSDEQSLLQRHFDVIDIGRLVTEMTNLEDTLILMTTEHSKHVNKNGEVVTEDVIILADGPGSLLFRGILEQFCVFHMIKFAAQFH